MQLSEVVKPMSSLRHIHSTGIYANECAQCYEAWVVDRRKDKKRMVASCSMCVSEAEYHWWAREVWSTSLQAWGRSAPEAA